jgi:hypothetical protein
VVVPLLVVVPMMLAGGGSADAVGARAVAHSLTPFLFIFYLRVLGRKSIIKNIPYFSL